LMRLSRFRLADRCFTSSINAVHLSGERCLVNGIFLPFRFVVVMATISTILRACYGVKGARTKNRASRIVLILFCLILL
jgi:hypothetical protein